MGKIGADDPPTSQPSRIFNTRGFTPSQTMDYYNIDYEALKKSVARLMPITIHGKALIVRDSKLLKLLPHSKDLGTRFWASFLKLEKTPGFNFLLSIALYATWIPLILSFIALATRKRKISLAASRHSRRSMAVFSLLPRWRCAAMRSLCSFTPLAFAIALSGTKQDEIPRELNAQYAKRDS